MKHLHSTVIKLILTLFNAILKSQKIPKDWNIALLYPIPKATSYDHKIENTRPIALLDCTRKLFLKIFTNRLNIFLSTLNCLQPNNRAGVGGNSCLEPISVVQHKITWANKYNRPLIIALQDMSKAYDRPFQFYNYKQFIFPPIPALLWHRPRRDNFSPFVFNLL